jgi:hypothetical protein
MLSVYARSVRFSSSRLLFVRVCAQYKVWRSHTVTCSSDAGYLLSTQTLLYEASHPELCHFTDCIECIYMHVY